MGIFEVDYITFQKIVTRESNELARNPIYYMVRRGMYELYFNDSHWKFKTYITLLEIEQWYENEDSFRNDVLQHAVGVIGYD